MVLRYQRKGEREREENGRVRESCEDL